MPRKIRHLIKDLKAAGFREITGGGKGSHRKFTHLRYPGAVTLSGQDGDDAKPYQVKQVQQAIGEVEEEDENE
jgi:predicted RNA binding protein YcfA (HicA-like mRNA interferase family)